MIYSFNHFSSYIPFSINEIVHAFVQLCLVHIILSEFLFSPILSVSEVTDLVILWWGSYSHNLLLVLFIRGHQVRHVDFTSLSWLAPNLLA